MPGPIRTNSTSVFLRVYSGRAIIDLAMWRFHLDQYLSRKGTTMSSTKRHRVRFHGLAPDRLAPDIPEEAWSSGSAVFFRNGETIRMPGSELAWTPSGVPVPRFLVSVDGANGPLWLSGDENTVLVWDGTAEFDVTPVAWALNPGGVWTTTTLSNVGVINCSNGDPIYWPGSTGLVCEPLPGWSPGGRCYAMRAHKNFLFAIGLYNVAPQEVAWSDAAEPGSIPMTWAASTSTLAGEVNLAPDLSPALDGRTLRDTMMIYKGETIWALDFVGGNAVFNVRKLFSVAGITATNALGGDQEKHIWLDSNGDVMATDGTNVKSIVDGLSQRAIAGIVAAFPQGRCSAGMVAREKTLVICYPSDDFLGEGADQAVIVDMQALDVGMASLQGADGVVFITEGSRPAPVINDGDWDGDAQAWQLDDTVWNSRAGTASLNDVMFSQLGGIWQWGSGEDGPGGPINAVADRTGMDLGDPYYRKEISRV